MNSPRGSANIMVRLYQDGNYETLKVEITISDLYELEISGTCRGTVGQEVELMDNLITSWENGLVRMRQVGRDRTGYAADPRCFKSFVLFRGMYLCHSSRTRRK